MIQVRRMSKVELAKTVPAEEVPDNFIHATPHLWCGFVGEDVVAVWGLVPPTLLSDVAYLWVHTNEKLSGNEFVFIRTSQRWMEEILEEYPTIVGHARVDMPQSIRWIRLCGGVFGESLGKDLIPFSIRRKS